MIGANGMLGKDIVQEWRDDEITSATSRDADIRNRDEVERLITATRPDWIVLTAAYTDVDGSEREPDAAFAVNAQGTENVAIMAQKYGAKVLYVSTDYVFDGNGTRPYEPGDPIAPINVYGESKARGEKAIQDHFRLVYRQDLMAVWRIRREFSREDSSRRRNATRADGRVRSVRLPHIHARSGLSIRGLVHANARGFVNVTNSGTCSWFEFASEILRQAGKPNPIKPINTVQAARAAKRPAYSVLSPVGLNALGIHVRHWREALPPYLEELRKIGKLS